jgi:His-Xaa-Ser system radical SAM maturase HxsB
MESPAAYSLLPFRFKKLGAQYLMVSEGGEHAFLDAPHFFETVTGQLTTESPIYRDLVARHLLREQHDTSFLPIVAAQVRSRYSPSLQGVALHIVVVTLRCDHGCPYCQVSRQGCSKDGFDLPASMVAPIVDRIFESKSLILTIEFQGGESLLAFDRIAEFVEAISERNRNERRSIRFVIASTLHHLTDEILQFCMQHDIYLSTSLDGPKALHDRNRPLPSGSSYDRTVAGIERARRAVGKDRVSALTTLTRLSLSQPRQIVDEYLSRGFSSIFLRPLSPYGFASRTAKALGYSVDEFLTFYKTAMDYVFELNRSGVYIEEAYFRLLSQRVLSPAATQYVDLSGIAGVGSSVLVYNYDGDIYLSDESRMLAEMGIKDLRLGRVTEPLQAFADSAAFEVIDDELLHLDQPGCSECAFLPYCGTDPVERLLVRRRTGETRIAGAFCRRHMGLFEYLFGFLADRDSDVTAIALSWLRPTGRAVGRTNPAQVAA